MKNNARNIIINWYDIRTIRIILNFLVLVHFVCHKKFVISYTNFDLEFLFSNNTLRNPLIKFDKIFFSKEMFILSFNYLFSMWFITKFLKHRDGNILFEIYHSLQ